MSLTVVIAASEAAPYAKTGGLGDVAGALPAALANIGVKAVLFMPYYRHVASLGVKVEATGWDVSVRSGQRVLQPVVYKAVDAKTPVYFITCDEFYDRSFLYGTPTGDYFDNLERFAFFSSAVLESCKAGGIKPDVLHCNDWQTGLIPAYLKGQYAKDTFFKKTATLFTVHNLAYQGLYNPELFSLTGLTAAQFTSSGVEFWGRISLLKAGLVYSDIINTVSKAYSLEIQTKEFGCGLDGVLGVRKADLYGVLNGVDYAEWNPEVDKLIPANYSPADLAGKAACKKAVIKTFGLKIKQTAPVIGMISRLAAQKGFDILPEAIRLLKSENFGLVIVGSGDKQYHDLISELALEFPGKVGVKLVFDNALAHFVEAGSDMFLMPSRYEPCGLNQMYSLKYGTVPIVRATGGLDDTIMNYAKGEGNGFKFLEYSSGALADKISEALILFSKKEEWDNLRKKIMHEDFSWDHAARNYSELYGFSMKKAGII